MVVLVVVVGSVVLVVVVVVVVVGCTHGTTTVWQVSAPSKPTVPHSQGGGQSDEIVTHADPFHFNLHGVWQAPRVVVVLVGHP